MPLYIRDRIVLPSYIPPYFKVELLSGIFSAIFYGIVVVLSGNCFHLLLKKRDIYPNRTRILLLVYVIFMLLNSTWKQVGSICILMANLNPKYMTNPFFYCAFGLPITMTMWGADGFMIWRCLVLYRQVSRGPRVVIIVLLSFLSFASFVCGVMALVDIFVFEPAYAVPVFTSLSALVNIILAALIMFRLVYHRRRVRDALGVQHGSPYTNVITMCVESSALMVIVGGLYTILCFVPVSPGGAKIMFDIIAHIYVISPLLIVYRVAIGRAVPPTSLPSEQVMAQIRDNIPLSNHSGQEREV